MTHLRTLPLLLTCLSLPAQVDPARPTRDQLNRVLGEQDPSRPAAGAPNDEEDPLLPVIVQLDLGYHENQASPARSAYVELSNLGVLAAPSLYRALDRLGPFGLNAALELLVQYPDERMTAALDRFLRSRDSSRQIVAARLMARVPIEIVRPLAAIARSSEILEVQLAGLAVQARDGMSDAELAAELLPLTEQKDQAFRLAMLNIIEERPLPGRALLPVLEKLAQLRYEYDPNIESEPASVALKEWSRRIGDDGEDAAIALFDELENVSSRFNLVNALSRPWTRFFVHAATHLPLSRNLHLLEALAKAPPSDLPDPVLNKLLAADREMQSKSGRRALDLVLATRRPSMAKAIGAVLLNGEVQSTIRYQCLAWLTEVAPEFLIENASLVLQDIQIAGEAAEFFASIDDRRTVRAAVDALRRLESNDVAFRPLLSVVSYRSTGDDLDAVLDLTSHPLDNGETTDERVAAARRALHRWLEPKHLPAAFARLFEVHQSVAADILQRAQEVAGPDQRDTVTALLARCRANWKSDADLSDASIVMSSSEAGLQTIEILRHLGGEADTAVLFDLLDAPQRELREAGFAALLTMDATTRQRTLTLALQRDGDPFRALQYRDVGEDPELRRLASDRLLSGAFAPSTYVSHFLSHCPETERSALINQLLRQAEERKDTVHVEDALVALGQLGRRGSEDELSKWILSHDQEIRAIAIELLGLCYTAAAAKSLLSVLRDNSASNRLLAQDALARFEAYLNEQARWERLLEGVK